MFKKLLYLATAALLLSACKGDYTDWTNPATPDPVTSQQVADFTVTSTCPTEALVLVDSVPFVKLVNFTLAQGYQVQNVRMHVTNGTKNQEFNLDSDGYAATADVQAAIAEIFGVKQEARTMIGYLTGDYVLGGTNTTTKFETLSDQTYVIMPLGTAFDYDKLWMPGNGNGWSHDVAPVLFSENMDGIFKGYAYMDGEFKFTEVAGWNKEHNNGHFNGTCSDNINLGDKQGGNIGFTGEPGLYYVVVDVTEGTIVATACSWGLVGAFTNWGSDPDVVMTYNTANHCLEATADFGASTEWKFRRDSAWGINYGGELSALALDGGNIAGAGTCTVQLFIERIAVDGAHATVTPN